jgi:HAD superfamily hydrolase (TIGR01509 family)
MSIQAIAWDIDGTLVDSEPLHLRAFIEGCRNWGVDVTDLPDEEFKGVHLVDVWNALRHRMPLGLEYTRWQESIEHFYVQHRNEIHPIPHAIETIRTLKDQGFRQAAVSNSGRKIVDANLRTLGIADHFEFSISLDDVTVGKPDPYPYSLACLRFHVSPPAVVAVEDSRTGAMSARAAGLIVAGLGLNNWTTGEVDFELGKLPELIQAIGGMAYRRAPQSSPR